MTPSQLSTLKAFVLASPDQAIQDAADARNFTELARLLNLPSAFYVWRIDVPTNDLIGAVKLASFTPADAPNDTLLFNNRAAVCELKQNNIRMLLTRDIVTSQKASTRQDLQDALTSVPAGTAGAALDAGWVGAGRVKDTIRRFATVAESAFATGAGTAGAPGDMGWEGLIDIGLLGEAWNL